MRKSIVLLIVSILFSCNSEVSRYRIKGEANKETQGKICIEDESGKIHKIDVKDKSFEFTGESKYPNHIKMLWEKDLQKDVYYAFDFYVDPGSLVSLSLNVDSIDFSYAEGGITQDQYNELNSKVGKIKQEWINEFLNSNGEEQKQKELGSFYNNKIFDVELSFIQDNPNSFLSPYLIYRNIERLDSSQINNMLSSLSSDLYVNKYYKISKDKLHSLELSRVGTEMINFKLKDTEGEEVEFYKVAVNKYVLIDLWFSNCKPCREANKELASLYDVYREKGFQIVSVSVDKNLDAWKSAVKQDSMKWINLIDHDSSSDLIRFYHGKSYPTTYLIDRNGLIKAINPKFEKVKEILTNEL